MDLVREARPGCGCILVALTFNLVLGAWSFSYCLYTLTGKAIPWYGNLIIGFFAGEITVPLAVILWLLSLFGVHVRL